VAPSYIEYVHSRPEWSELLCRLADANHFTAADLEANRRLLVGPDQFSYHLRTALLPFFFMPLGGIAVSVIVRVAFPSGHFARLNR